LRDRRSRSSSLSLIEFAWSTGKIDADSYATLKEICEQGAAGPVDTGPRSGSGGVHDRKASGAEESTRQRGSDPAAGETRRADTDSTRARSQSGASSGSHPSGGWITNPSQWDDETKTLEPGTVLKERFVLEEVLGRGGMGTVFHAKDLRKEEAQDRYPYVAVKILNEDFRKHPDSLKALQREARKAQALAHPNIVAVYDFDRDGQLVFLVMELLEGTSLERLIKDGSRRGLPPTEALRILRGLGAALAHAHEKGVVHCDFKPANAFRCGDGSIKVFDFGIARAIARQNTRSGYTTRFDAGSLGALTPGYASCELELGGEPDPRDDVFALACVAYELFSGKHPYDHASALEAERSGVKLEPIEGLDRRTWRGLQRGLAFARKDRTPTIQEFIAELAPSRNIGIAIGAGAAAAGLVALVAGLVLYFSADRPKQEVAKAETQATDAAPAPPPIAVIERPSVGGGNNTTSNRAPQQQTKPPAAVPPAQRPAAQPASAGLAAVPNASDQMDAASSAATKKEEAVQAASAEVLKKQLIAAAQTNSVINALDALQALQARLPPSDPFLVEEAPAYIGKAYQRLGNQALASGNFDAAVSLFERAKERLGDDPALQSSLEQVTRVKALAQTLELESNISAEAIQEQLRQIRDAGDQKTFAVINERLADIFASRIKKELESAPDAATANLGVARAVFAGVPSIDAIKTTQVAAE